MTDRSSIFEVKKSLGGGIAISVCVVDECRRFRELIDETVQPNSLLAHGGPWEKDDEPHKDVEVCSSCGIGDVLPVFAGRGSNGAYPAMVNVAGERNHEL